MNTGRASNFKDQADLGLHLKDGSDKAKAAAGFFGVI